MINLNTQVEINLNTQVEINLKSSYFRTDDEYSTHSLSLNITFSIKF